MSSQIEERFQTIDRHDVRAELDRIRQAVEAIIYDVPPKLPGETDEEAYQDHVEWQADAIQDALASLRVLLKRLEVLQ